MVAELLAVGTELLMGQIANTNAQYITSRLQEVGVDVYFHSVVGDNPERLKSILTQALTRADVIIMTGGLGPTKDDLTKETVAELFQKKLIPHEESVERITKFFNRLGREISQNNLKQADMPEGCQIMRNNNGTAPGCIVTGELGTVILLPGPPSEMKPMFDENVMPWLQKQTGYKIYSKYVKVFGIGESKLEDMIIDIIEGQTNPTVAPYVKDGVVTIRVTAKCKNNTEGEILINPIIKEIIARTEDSVFSIDNETMAEVVVKLLRKHNLVISCAESCSGGLLASSIVDVPRASDVFNQGFVTYSNESKITELNVNPKTLEKFGAVSEEVAIEMANGLFVKSKCDIAVSVTGIAGPDGGTKDKPVGLVYIGFKTIDREWTLKLNLWGDRTRIRLMSVLSALDQVRKYISGKY